jgi:hypothetical protein
MATEYGQRTVKGGVREYPTEWSWYPPDADAEEGQQDQREGSRIESVTTAEKPKYLTNHAG